MRQSGYLPLGESEEVIATAALKESRNAEPAGLAVIAGSAVAGDGVLDDLAAAAGGDDLGGISKVADDGHAGNGARGGGAEGAGGAKGRAAEHEGRHGWRRCWLVGGDESEKKKKKKKQAAAAVRGYARWMEIVDATLSVHVAVA